MSMVPLGTNAQSRPKKNLATGEIELALKKLNTLGSVLYIAAHPDDENTRLIAWLANERLARTAYLSLTRGDGGQNLIGIEKGALMGVLRTQELMEARKIDNGEQFFTRAVDFGYSKNADETLEIWDHQQVLEDAVWAIRQFRPDVIITRFPSSEGGGHGHHTASAIIAEEAAYLAGDANAFPEQLKFVQTWSPTRIYLNASTWWDKELEEKAAGSAEYVILDVGAYNPLLGKSYTEIASESRSMHKSQGFGSSGTRGSKLEYLQIIKGEREATDVFSGLDISWSRISGGAEITEMVEKISRDYNSKNPFASVPALAQVKKKLASLPKNSWVKQKNLEVDNLIMACSGLWIEALAEQHTYTMQEEVKIYASITARNAVEVQLLKTVVGTSEQGHYRTLTINEADDFEILATAPNKTSNPYWLDANFDGMFVVDDPINIGKPENDAALVVKFYLMIEGQELVYEEPVRYRWTDRVKGELYRPLSVVPPVTFVLPQSVFIISQEGAAQISVVAKAHKAKIEDCKISVKLPAGWKSEPPSLQASFTEAGEEKAFTFALIPPANAATGNLIFSATVQGTSYSRGFTEIEYDHIQTQTVLMESKVKLAYIPQQVENVRIGYIMGAGDEIPEVLQQMGYVVETLNPSALALTDLSGFSAIVAGVRAYNTEASLKHTNSALLKYVENGGTLVVQYNTDRGLVIDQFAPYSLKLSRNRVTREDAAPTFLRAEHGILNTPHKLELQDFDGWVQERGLYFAGEWSEEFVPIIGWNDPEDELQKGGLLCANFGKGVFIYTGISFFRQLPAGVPGAIKLFINLISQKGTDQ